jgi:hypothetical protein
MKSLRTTEERVMAAQKFIKAYRAKEKVTERLEKSTWWKVVSV